MDESPFDGLEVREGPPRSLPGPRSAGCSVAMFVLIIIGCTLFTCLVTWLGR